MLDFLVLFSKEKNINPNTKLTSKFRFVALLIFLVPDGAVFFSN